MPTTSMDPLELMRQMREDGYNLKQNVLGHRLNPKHSNQQFIPSDESDPEMDFLKSLSSKQKKKLLKKLNKLSKKQKKKDEAKKNKIKRKDKGKKETAAVSSSDSEEKPKHKKKKSKSRPELSDHESETGSSDEECNKPIQEKAKRDKERHKKSHSDVAFTQQKKHRKKVSDHTCSSDESCDESSKKVRNTRKRMKTTVLSHAKDHSTLKRKSKTGRDDSCSESEHSPVCKKVKSLKNKEEKKSHIDSSPTKKQEDSASILQQTSDSRKFWQENKSSLVDAHLNVSVKPHKNKQKQNTDSTCDKSLNYENKYKTVKAEELSVTKKEKSAKTQDHKNRTKTHSSSEDSSTEKCHTISNADKSTASKDLSNKKHIHGSEHKKSENSQTESADDVQNGSPMHPDGFDHENPQRNTTEDKNVELSLISNYGINHDRFRNLHRHRRSPSVKHKYRK